MDFSPFLHWSDQFYTRNCIVRTNKYELILLCWEKGQTTPIHSHGGEECWVYLIQGDIEESRFEYGKKGMQKVHENFLANQPLSYMNDDLGFHQLRNSFEGRSISLHLYADPINNCQIYCKKTQCLEDKELIYHTINGKWVEPHLAT